MLLAAALVPPTALLVPGVAGRASVLGPERAASRAAVADLLDTGPDRVVVVVAGRDGEQRGALRPTLTAAGVDDALLGEPVPVLGEPGTGPATVTDVAGAVGLHLLADAGWTGPVTVRSVGPRAELERIGRVLVQGPERVALLLCAGLSARRGPGAPLAEDDRAEAVDDAVLAGLLAVGAATSDGAATGVSAELAEELAVGVWAPWRVLAAAAAVEGSEQARLTGEARLVGVPLGATFAVLLWRRERSRD